MKRSQFKSLPTHRGFKRPDYPALLAAQIAKRKPGAMEPDRAKPGHKPILCEVCGALVYVSPQRFRAGVSTCPLHRKRKAQKAIKARVDRELIAWSKKVRERDDYTCRWPQCCYRSPAIHAHHILTRSQRPDLRTDPANGAAICPEHHDFLHHTVEGRRQAREIGLLGTETYERSQKEKRAA